MITYIVLDSAAPSLTYISHWPVYALHYCMPALLVWRNNEGKVLSAICGSGVSSVEVMIPSEQNTLQNSLLGHGLQQLQKQEPPQEAIRACQQRHFRRCRQLRCCRGRARALQILL